MPGLNFVPISFWVAGGLLEHIRIFGDSTGKDGRRSALAFVWAFQSARGVLVKIFLRPRKRRLKYTYMYYQIRISYLAI